MGWKDWVYGDLVSAADFQSLVQDQTVQRYATTAARTSALGSAVAEGMVSYQDDTNQLEVYSGSGWDVVRNGSGNAIINGAFEINQRNFTSNTAAGSFNFDRWFQDNGGTSGTLTTTPQTFTPGAAPVAGYEGSTFLQGITAAGANTNTYALYINRIENVRSFAGETATFSFWAKAALGTPKVALELIQNFGTGGSPSGANNFYAGQVTLSTSWARYSITVAIPSLSGKTIGTAANSSYLSVQFWISGGSDFNSRTGSIGIQNNTFQFWGFQAEAGSSATPFRRNGVNIADELASCQRYYYRNVGSNNNSSFASGFAISTTQAFFAVHLPVTMRATPTAIEFSTTGVNLPGIGNTSATAMSIVDSNPNVLQVGATVASGLTQFRPYMLAPFISSTGFIGFSAEL